MTIPVIEGQINNTLNAILRQAFTDALNTVAPLGTASTNARLRRKLIKTILKKKMISLKDFNKDFFSTFPITILLKLLKILVIQYGYKLTKP